MEIFAPVNSYHLDNYKNRQVKVLDFSSGKERQPETRYALYFDLPVQVQILVFRIRIHVNEPGHTAKNQRHDQRLLRQYRMLRREKYSQIDSQIRRRENGTDYWRRHHI